MSKRSLLWSAAVALGLIFGTAAGAQERLLRHDEAAPGRLDPSKVSDYAASVLAYNLYDTLIESKPGGGVVPHLAESWTASDDRKSYTFKLRPGVKFHSGNVMTADDVVFSLERMLALASGHSRLFNGIVATADDENTVTFKLPAVNSTFLPALVRLPIVDKATVMAHKLDGKHGEFGDYGEDFLSREDAGTGAYRMVTHNPQAETTMKLFPGYFGDVAEKAPTDVLLRYGVQAPTVRTLMANNEWEATSQWLPSEIKRSLVESGKVLVGEGGAGYFIMPLNTRRAPTDDVHVRRAISMALDYDTMRKLMEVVPGQEVARPMNGVIPSGMLGYDASIPPHTLNIEAAKAELAKSKYGNDIPALEVIWVAEVAVEEKFALLVQQNLQQIGLKVSVVKMPWALLVDRAGKAETTPNMTQVFVWAAYPDPDSLIGRNHSSNIGSTIKMDWSDDQQLDALLEKARTVGSADERDAVYKEIQLRMMDEVPDIWAFESYTTFVKQDYVSAPPLDHADQAVAVQGGNWQFRKWSINK
jgi:peptide/nickel transport system substrate-binding protein